MEKYETDHLTEEEEREKMAARLGRGQMITQNQPPKTAATAKMAVLIQRRSRRNLAPHVQGGKTGSSTGSLASTMAKTTI